MPTRRPRLPSVAAAACVYFLVSSSSSAQAAGDTATVSQEYMSHKTLPDRRTRRHHRRRRDRLLDCLSSHQARVPRGGPCSNARSSPPARPGMRRVCSPLFATRKPRPVSPDTARSLYRKLESETGQATGFIGCGSIQLAKTPDKAQEMRRGLHMAACFGVEAHEITPCRGRKIVAARRDRRSEGGVLFSERRPRQSDGCNAGTRQGRSSGRRADLRKHPGDRHPHARGPRRRRSHRRAATCRQNSSSTAPACGHARWAAWRESTCRCRRLSTTI